MPQLIFYVERDYPQARDLSAGKISIGRNKDNDIALHDSRVSVYHAELRREDDEFYRLYDLDSQNGTTVNGKPVDGTVLKDGDQIKFGLIKAVFVDQRENPDDLAENQIVESLQKEIQSKSEKLAELEEIITAKTSVIEGIQKQEKELEALKKEHAALQIQSKQVRTATENSLRKKQKLEAKLEGLGKEIGTAIEVLKENMRASGEAKVVIEEAKAIKVRIGELTAELKTLEKKRDDLGMELSERNHALEEVSNSLDAKRQVAADLASEVSKNDDLIRSASERLATLKSTLKSSLDELFHSRTTQQTLSKESGALSRLIHEKTAVLQRVKDKINARKNGTEGIVTCPPLRVINPQMSSLVQYFHHGAGGTDQDRVVPIGYQGLAACTRGSMHRESDSIFAGDEPVLVLLQGELKRDRDLIESISREMPGRILLACWREGQLNALAPETENGLDSLQLTDLLKGVSGIVSVDPCTSRLLDELQLGLPHLNVPLPYPLEFAEWSNPTSHSIRPHGVFVSTDGFDPDSRIHRARLQLLNQLVSDTKATATLYHDDSNVIEGLQIPDERRLDPATGLKYSEYLALIGKHRLVTGFGKHQFGGDMMGDAILARTVFIGGDRTNVLDELLFPDSCIGVDDIENALKNATRLLADNSAFGETIERAQDLANQLFSFETLRDRLSEFLHFISANPSGV